MKMIDIYRALFESTLSVIVGNPNVGKSSFLLHFCHFSPKRCIVIINDMSESILQKLLSKLNIWRPNFEIIINHETELDKMIENNYLDLDRCFLAIDNMSFFSPISVVRSKPLLAKLSSQYVQTILIQHLSRKGFLGF